MSAADQFLLKGKYPDMRKMKVKEIKEECQMWRNIWNWTPSEVKYYVARVGQMVAITQRNYRRMIGILLDTHWTLDELEIGVYEKEYDQNTGDYYWERKVVKTRLSGIMDFQIIAERKSETEMAAEEEKPAPAPDVVDVKQSDNQL